MMRSRRIALYRGTVSNDAFYFAPIVNGVRVNRMIMDTGAFELTFNAKVARRLGLPNVGSIQIGGVGGAAQAYRSKCNLTIGGHVYHDVPCIVAPGFENAGLFGLRFFIDNHLLLTLNPIKRTLLIRSA